MGSGTSMTRSAARGGCAPPRLASLRWAPRGSGRHRWRGPPGLQGRFADATPPATLARSERRWYYPARTGARTSGATNSGGDTRCGIPAVRTEAARIAAHSSGLDFLHEDALHMLASPTPPALRLDLARTRGPRFRERDRGRSAGTCPLHTTVAGRGSRGCAVPLRLEDFESALDSAEGFGTSQQVSGRTRAIAGAGRRSPLASADSRSPGARCLPADCLSVTRWDRLGTRDPGPPRLGVRLTISHKIWSGRAVRPSPTRPGQHRRSPAAPCGPARPGPASIGDRPRPGPARFGPDLVTRSHGAVRARAQSEVGSGIGWLGPDVVTGSHAPVPGTDTARMFHTGRLIGGPSVVGLGGRPGRPSALPRRHERERHRTGDRRRQRLHPAPPVNNSEFAHGRHRRPPLTTCAAHDL